MYWTEILKIRNLILKTLNLPDLGLLLFTNSEYNIYDNIY